MKKQEFLQAYDDLVAAGKELLSLYLDYSSKAGTETIKEIHSHPKLESKKELKKKEVGPNTLYSEEEAASFLNVTRGTLQVWRSIGRYNIPFIKIGRLVRYKHSVLENFLHEREQSHTGYFKNQ